MRNFSYLLIFSLSGVFAALADSNPPHPEGLLLRGFESEAAFNRRGDQAVLNGVLTTVRIDAAGEVNSTTDGDDLAPLVGWYRDRDQYYAAYADFAPGIGSAIGYLNDISSAGKALDLDGNVASPSIFLSETYDAILAVAKAYVDAGVDAIDYDTAWVALDAGPFDAQTMVDFRTWLNARYGEVTLQSYIDSSYDASTFDYGAFLRAEGVTVANYGSATIDSEDLGETKHWRLWHAFLRFKEREVIATFVDEVNTYALAELGREIGFYFNRYGFIDRPADRWFLAEYASGDLGETHFSGQTWDYFDGYSLEPVFRAGLKTFDNRFEPWNSPPQIHTASQSVFLAETIANNGVATWEDDYPATSGVARMARRYEAQVDHTPISEAAIFYPLATALHTEALQVGPDPGLLGGDHYWYLGLGYILQELNINYDVAFGGDGLGMPDAFSSSDLNGYEVVFASEAIQITDNQFTEILDYVNAGGTLIVTGTNNFRYDALGNDQSSTRTYASNSWSDLFGSVGTTTVGSGEVKVLSLDPWGSYGYTDQPSSATLDSVLNGFTSALPSGAPAVSSGASGEVRALRFLDDSDDSEVYHLINYTFNSVGSAVTTQTSFNFSFPTPSSFSGTPVAQYATSAESDPVSLTITDLGSGVSQVTIPSLTYWGILRVGSVIDAPPHPNVPPIAYFDSLFSYEVFSVEATRSQVYTAVDDDELDQVQVYYQVKDTSTGLFGSWVAGDITSGLGTNEIIDSTLDITFPEEGHYRIQLIATDSDGDSNALIDGSYDTEIGYDTTPVDRSALVVYAVHGVADGGVITSPVTPSFTATGYEDLISGFGQFNYLWMNGGNTIEGDGGSLGETVTLDSLPAIVEGEYGEYTLSMRFQNGSQVWDDIEEVYSLIYTIPPTYTGDAIEETTTAGSTVNFDLEYTNVYGAIAIQWYKEDEAISGETGDTLSLNNVSDDDNGVYTAIISNEAGGVTSETFTLTVNTVLEIQQQPQGDTVDQGDPFSVTVTVVGQGDLSFQWMLSNVDIDGAISQTYSVGSADRVTHQGPYRVRITDSLTSVTSNSAFVTVNDQPGGGGGGGGEGTPNKPTNLNGVDNGNSVSLGWSDAASNETGFVLERRLQGELTWTQVDTIETNGNFYEDDLDVGTDTYEYRVKATGSSSDSEYSNVATVSRAEEGSLGAPTNLSASDNIAHVFLQWSDNATEETGYVIERKLLADSVWGTVATIGADSQAFTDNTNIGTDTYNYRVKAIKDNENSDYSNEVSISRSSGGGEGGGEGSGAPASPASLAGVDNGSNVSLTWDDSSNNETGFLIERQKQGAGGWSHLTTTAANVTSYVDDTDIGSDTYEYRVKAINGEESSEASNVASVSRSSGGEGGGEEPEPPVAPSSLSAVDSGSSVTLTWLDNSSDETGFAILRRIHGSSTWFAAGTVAANTTSFVDSIDIGADTYEYRVAADKNEVASDYSNTASVSRSTGSSELVITAIVSGGDVIELTVSTSDTLGTLRSELASQTQLDSSSLLIYRGEILLNESSQTLESAGFHDGDQFTVLIEGETEGGSYASWTLLNFESAVSNRLPNEDYDQSGPSNFVHYAQGVGIEGSLKIVSNEASVVVSYSQSKVATELELTLEVSLDSMEEWQSAETFGMIRSAAADPDNEGVEIVTWTHAAVSDDSFIVRLKIESK